jgi:hypothetical protein
MGPRAHRFDTEALQQTHGSRRSGAVCYAQAARVISDEAPPGHHLHKETMSVHAANSISTPLSVPASCIRHGAELFQYAWAPRCSFQDAAVLLLPTTVHTPSSSASCAATPFLIPHVTTVVVNGAMIDAQTERRSFQRTSGMPSSARSFFPCRSRSSHNSHASAVQRRRMPSAYDDSTCVSRMIETPFT